MLAAKAPGAVTLDAAEGWRVNRARLARLLHKLPGEIDAAPYLDLLDVIEVMRADDEIEAQMVKQKLRQAARGRRRGRR